MRMCGMLMMSFYYPQEKSLLSKNVWYADDVILLSSRDVIIFEGVKMANTQFGQNFEAIFRENGGLSEHGTTPIEFVMPKSSFPQKFGQGFALGELSKLQTLGKFPWGASKG